MVLVFLSFVSVVNCWTPVFVDVFSEVELRDAICAAPYDKPYTIGVVGDIFLEKPLEIPSGKCIMLVGGGGCLVGCDGMDTIIVRDGGRLTLLFQLVVTHVEGASGRGVYVERGGVFEMSGGTICGNSAVRGGGVYNEGYFELWGGERVAVENYGGVIVNNTAQYGGGVYNGGYFITYWGDVCGNVAVRGGGVYSVGVFDEFGSRTVVSNVATSGVGVDVFVDNSGFWWVYFLVYGVVIVVCVGWFFCCLRKRKQLVSAG